MRLASLSTGTTSIAPMIRSAAEHRMRFTSRVHQRRSSHASSPDEDGHADPPVQSRRSTYRAIRVIQSSSRSIAWKTACISRSYGREMQHDRCHARSIRAHRCARCVVSAFFSFRIAKHLATLHVNISALMPQRRPGKLSKCSRRKSVGHSTRRRPARNLRLGLRLI